MTLDEKVDKLVTDVAEIKTALKYNGSGLIPTFEKHCARDHEFRMDYYRFKRICIAVFFFMVGSAGIGFGVFELLKVMP